MIFQKRNKASPRAGSRPAPNQLEAASSWIGIRGPVAPSNEGGGFDCLEKKTEICLLKVNQSSMILNQTPENYRSNFRIVALAFKQCV